MDYKFNVSHPLYIWWHFYTQYNEGLPRYSIVPVMLRQTSNVSSAVDLSLIQSTGQVCQMAFVAETKCAAR